MTGNAGVQFHVECGSVDRQSAGLDAYWRPTCNVPVVTFRGGLAAERSPLITAALLGLRASAQGLKTWHLPVLGPWSPAICALSLARHPRSSVYIGDRTWTLKDEEL